MKYVAKVKRVLHEGIHRVNAIENDEVKAISHFPLPGRVEIELDGSEDEPCMMYRYTDDECFVETLGIRPLKMR